jgi:hypothetical protein
VHGTEGWREVLEPVIARYRGCGLALYVRGDAAFARPELDERLQAERCDDAIRLPANPVLQERIAPLLTRPAGSANSITVEVLPNEVAPWTLTTLREKLVTIGARIVRHGRYVIFQLAEVAVPRALFAAILRRIDRWRGPPVVA